MRGALGRRSRPCGGGHWQQQRAAADADAEGRARLASAAGCLCSGGRRGGMHTQGSGGRAVAASGGPLSSPRSRRPLLRRQHCRGVRHVACQSARDGVRAHGPRRAGRQWQHQRGASSSNSSTSAAVGRRRQVLALLQLLLQLLAPQGVVEHGPPAAAHAPLLPRLPTARRAGHRHHHCVRGGGRLPLLQAPRLRDTCRSQRPNDVRAAADDGGTAEAVPAHVRRAADARAAAADVLPPELLPQLRVGKQPPERNRREGDDVEGDGDDGEGSRWRVAAGPAHEEGVLGEDGQRDGATAATTARQAAPAVKRQHGRRRQRHSLAVEEADCRRRDGGVEHDDARHGRAAERRARPAPAAEARPGPIAQQRDGLAGQRAGKHRDLRLEGVRARARRREDDALHELKERSKLQSKATAHASVPSRLPP